MATRALNPGQFALGATAAITTSMGLIAGLSYGADPRASIIGGLLVIAIADNVSDSFAIHVYKESEGTEGADVLPTTIGNFLVRLAVTLSFVVMVLALPVSIVIWPAAAWGLALLAIISFGISRRKQAAPGREVAIHLVVAVGVIAISRYLGHIIAYHIR